MTDLSQLAIIVDPERDNVAVAKSFIPAGITVLWQGHAITVRGDISPGHRFALHPVPAGEWMRQYGQPFACSKGLHPGDPVDDVTVESVAPLLDADDLILFTPVLPPWDGPLPTFDGFHRPDGLAGTRNWVLVVPTSMCSSHEASQIALRAEATGVYTRERYPNVDGVTAIPHTGGCGCAYPLAGAPARGTMENTLRILAQHIRHPNVGAVLMIELGCEKTGFAAFDAYFGADLSARYGKPVLQLTIQELGGTQATIERALALLPDLLAEANTTERRPTPLSALSLGLECGGSDAFSGLSANPALGQASDLLIRAGGRSIISEVPEFSGAEALFAQRAVNRGVANDVFAIVARYREYAALRGHTLEDNPSPGNKAGGLLNITIKSLGAQAKSGSAPVQGVMEYGDWVWEHDGDRAGIYLLNTPGYDPPSVTGLVGAGCQIVCFTTGRGSVFGNAIAPVIKIGTNDALYARMSANIDVNAGAILRGDATLPDVGRTIFEEIVAVASGKYTKAELSGHREFMLWNNEGLLT